MSKAPLAELSDDRGQLRVAGSAGTRSRKVARSARSDKRTIPPALTRAQRLAHLARANEVRSARARLKRDIRARRMSVLTPLREPPEYIETMKVWDLLLAVPKIGRVKVNKMLTRCRIGTMKTIGGISDRQRRELLDALHWQPIPVEPPLRKVA